MKSSYFNKGNVLFGGWAIKKKVPYVEQPDGVVVEWEVVADELGGPAEWVTTLTIGQAPAQGPVGHSCRPNTQVYKYQQYCRPLL